MLQKTSLWLLKDSLLGRFIQSEKGKKAWGFPEAGEVSGSQLLKGVLPSGPLSHRVLGTRQIPRGRC